MKTIVIKFFLVSLLGLAMVGFYGCNHDNDHEGHSHEGTEHADDHSGHDHGATEIASTSKYMCPMECEGSNLEEAGQCPVCGMDLVLREGNDTDGDDHDGHDHGDAEHDEADHDDGGHDDHAGHDHSH